MLSFLDPRLWLAFLLAVALSSGASYYKGRSNGRQVCEADYAKRAVLANNEARRLEAKRQDMVDEAARVAAARTARLAADARRANGELVGLRGAVDSAQRAAEKSQAAADQYRATCSKLLVQSGELLTEIARSADGHASDVRLLLESWPK